MMKKTLTAALLLLTALPLFAQAQNAWTNTFTIEIFSRPVPEISTNNLSITVAQGSTASESITLENNGNLPVGFTIEDDVEISALNASWQILSGWVAFEKNPDRDPPEIPPLLPIGFEFPYLDQTFETVQILQNGSMQLDFNLSLRPFFGNTTTDTRNLRYKQEPDRMVIAWIGARTTDGELNDLEFQVQLYRNGEIRYLYKSMDGATVDDAFVGYVINRVSTDLGDPETVTITDGSSILANDSMVVLSPEKFINTSPAESSISAGSSAPLTFIVDAEGQSGGTKSYEFTVNWDNGSNDTVNVDVIVGAQTASLDVLPSASVSLPAPPGSVVKDSVILTNDGNVDLDYSFFNSAAQSAEYNRTRTTFNWIKTAGGEFTPIDITAKDSGFTDLLSLGFAFPYFGAAYTNFSLSVDGFISLGAEGPTAQQIIAPLWQDLYYDNNSRIHASGDSRLHTITWENMQSEHGDNQSFQLILERDGTITFQYLNLDGTNDWITSNIASSRGIGLKDTSSRIVSDTLVWSAGPDNNIGTVITNIVVTQEEIPNPDRDYGTITVQVTNQVVVYDDPLINQAFSYVPAGLSRITVSPLAGSLAAGESQQITIMGDARGLSSGASESASYDILSDAPTKTLTIDFIVSAPAPAELAIDSDDDGLSDMAEVLAGTDAQNADSTFKINMDGSRTITWAQPDDALNRTYTIWFTTSLLEEWTELETIENGSSFTDTEHNDEPVIYYKVTIE